MNIDRSVTIKAKIGEARPIWPTQEQRDAAAVNQACRALGCLSLEGMTWVRWSLLSDAERLTLVNWEGINPALHPMIGDRVEVIHEDGSKERFWVGKSTGWMPVLLKRKLATSRGGEPIAADQEYRSIRVVKRADHKW